MCVFIGPYRTTRICQAPTAPERVTGFRDIQVCCRRWASNNKELLAGPSLLNTPSTAHVRTSSSQQNTTRPTIIATDKIW